jgi:hypothetical protein
MNSNKIPDNLSGQYIGGYTNVSSGKSSIICVNIDHIDAGKHEASATIYSGDKIYNTKFSFDWTKNSPRTPVTVNDITEYIRQGDGNFKKSEPKMQQYKKADLTIQWASGLRLTWTTNNGEEMQSDGLVKTGDEQSELASTKLTWVEFKELIKNCVGRHYIFRGQSSRKRLRTSFHRANRSNIARYYKHNLPELQHFLSSVHKDYFKITESSQLIPMLTLAQHHGYPTPILDWTESPYIASYFGFIDAARKIHEDSNRASSDYIRIYQFNLEEYQNDFPQFQEVNDSNLHVSFVVTPSLNNPRAIPQQSMSCVSTIDDIEGYLDHVEKKMNKKYLTAYDILVSEGENALKDLELMGITPASLFPGLDGICAYLKRKHFAI